MSLCKIIPPPIQNHSTILKKKRVTYCNEYYFKICIYSYVINFNMTAYIKYACFLTVIKLFFISQKILNLKGA